LKLEALLAETKDRFLLNVNGQLYESLQYAVTDTIESGGEETKFKAELVQLNDKPIFENVTGE